MLRKLAILATGAVVAFMVIALISGFLVRDESRRPIEVDPSRVPEQFQKPDATGNRIPRPGEGTDAWIQRTDPKTGRLVQEFRYDKLEPLTEGEFKVTRPQARFHLALNRVIDIRANTGTIIAPQNIPQQGTFKDGVVVRLYETRKDQKLDLTDESTDIVAVIHLQDATFNSQLGKLDSAGDVLLEGRNAEFRGRGLVLVYNEPQQRIDYLEITQGQYLKYTPAPEGSKTPEKTGTAGATEKPADTAPMASDGKVQFYQVQFERSVHVRSGGRSIDADDLLGYFAFNRRSNIARMQSARQVNEPETATLLAGTDANATAMALAEAKTPAPGTAAASASQEVVMTWAGKMVVTPMTQRPERLRTDQDLLLNFRGRPVTIRSENDDVMTCATAEYHEFRREVAAIGSGEFPLLIESPSLGEVTADALSLRLSDQVGKLQGAGYIKSKAQAPAAAAAAVADAAGGAEVKPATKAGDKGLPAGFAIRWTDHVDLLLTPSKEKPAGLKTAQFVGNVEVNDPRFTMNGEQLAVHFEPDVKGRSRRLGAVDASGNVVAQSEDGRIVAQTLHLDTAESADGKIHPTVLVASGNVQISDKTQAISAGALSATFTDKTAINKGKAKIDVSQILATDHVMVKLEDGTEASADQMEADNTTGIATLSGSPVVVGKDGAKLRVAKLHLNRAKEVATAEGKGQFDFEQVEIAEKPRGPEAAAGTANGKSQPMRRTMHVTWADGMTFDQHANLLTVKGDVVAEQSDRPEEQNKLTAASVELEMMDRKLARQQGVELKGRSLLKRMDARGDVVLLSSRWLDAAHKQLEARLLLKGPNISFDNNRELALVQGAGLLQLEDYRRRGAAEASAQTGAVQMNGHGATLFTWSRWMTMDGAKTNIVMDGNVEMTHRPGSLNSKQPEIQMQTNRLTADMKGIGGIEALSASKTQKLDIDHIEAEGGVQLRDDKRLISAHHLYYDGAAQTATIEAQPGRRVNVIQLDEPKPTRAQRIIWDLKKDRLEIDQPGY